MNTRSIYQALIAPRSADPNTQNQEIVLNWLLVASLGLTLAAFVSTVADYISLQADYLLDRLFILCGVFVFFGLLLLLSRQRQQRIVPSLILVAIFFIAASLIIFRWDISNPFGVLLFSVAIVIAGILLSARFSLYTALLTILALSVYMWGKTHGIWSPNLSWIRQPSRAADVASFSAIYAVLALTTWLFNRQMETALSRANRSERALKRQKDLLEIKVEQRTRELQAAQLEQVQQFYRLAELGRLSTALFHDLANHVMSVSIDIEGLQKRQQSDMLARIKENIHHIDGVVRRVRRQIGGKNEIERFNVIEEIREVISMLTYFGDRRRVSIELRELPSRKPIPFRGDLTRFRQLVINLLSNAIEAYPAVRSGRKQRPVIISVSRPPGTLIIEVADCGEGIRPAMKAKVFEPFYSTKDTGTGIGLFIVKKIVEEDLGGTISVTSDKRTGTTFTVTLPLKHHG